MLKLLATALVFAFTLGTTALAVAQTIPPPNPPSIRYILPGATDSYSSDRLREGRSIYRMEAPSIFYYGTDERGYPSGEPQNPRTATEPDWGAAARTAAVATKTGQRGCGSRCSYPDFSSRLL